MPQRTECRRLTARSHGRVLSHQWVCRGRVVASIYSFNTDLHLGVTASYWKRETSLLPAAVRDRPAGERDLPPRPDDARLWRSGEQKNSLRKARAEWLPAVLAGQYDRRG